jgi:hypothetical protein
MLDRQGNRHDRQQHDDVADQPASMHYFQERLRRLTPLGRRLSSLRPRGRTRRLSLRRACGSQQYAKNEKQPSATNPRLQSELLCRFRLSTKRIDVSRLAH